MGSSEYGGRRVIQKQNVDRISNLPDELLSHILSRLPAKWAFQTSILSKRWEKIWTSITCLVEAPNLEYLHLSEGFITYNTEGNFSSLVKAYVNIGHISKRHDFKDFPRSFALPNFASLTCLDVFSCENRFWAMLPKFLRSTPSLEVLSIEQKDGHDNVIDDEYDWVEPKSVAKCVRHHIGVIKVEGFKGRKHELQLIKYFLGSAKVLKTLTVRCQGAKHEEEIKFVGKLLDFSRASKDCRVKFHGNVI